MLARAYSSQRGVGLVEVLVSMILLGIAVIGYSALQVRATLASTESSLRTNATMVIRSFNEAIKSNRAVVKIRGGNSSDLTNLMDTYSTGVNTAIGANGLTAPTPNCTSSLCTPTEQASWDVYQAKSAASNVGVSLRMVTCPGTSSGISTQCLIAAWDQTNATIGTAAADCMSTDGVYNVQAACLMMEAY